MTTIYTKEDVNKIHPVFTVEQSPTVGYIVGDEYPLKLEFAHSSCLDGGDVSSFTDFAQSYYETKSGIRGDPTLFMQMSIMNAVEDIADAEKHGTDNETTVRQALLEELQAAVAYLQQSLQEK